MWYDKKYDGDHTEEAIDICGPCSQERRASEAGSGREVRGEKRARKKKAGLHGGGLASATGYSAVELLRRTGDRIGFREVVARERP